MTTSVDVLLAATDFSPVADRAVGRAAQLARDAGVPLRLVHATGDGDWLARIALELEEDFGLERVARAAADRLEEVRERLVAGELQAVECDVVQTSLGVALPSLLHGEERGILVMGAGGQGGWREGLLGSTADRVIRTGHLPVLLVRQAAEAAYGRVLLATDFSPASFEAARVGRALAPGAEHFLLHALELPLDRDLAFANANPASRRAFHDAAMRRAMERLATAEADLGAGGRLTRAIHEGRPADTIEAFVREAGIDLVVLGVRARSRWEAHLLGSTALFATQRLGCDVLLVPEPAAARPE